MSSEKRRNFTVYPNINRSPIIFFTLATQQGQLTSAFVYAFRIVTNHLSVRCRRPIICPFIGLSGIFVWIKLNLLPFIGQPNRDLFFYNAMSTKGGNAIVQRRFLITLQVCAWKTVLRSHQVRSKDATSEFFCLHAIIIKNIVNLKQ